MMEKYGVDQSQLPPTKSQLEEIKKLASDINLDDIETREIAEEMIETLRASN